VAHNEQKTPGSTTVNLSVNREVRMGPVEAVISLSANNLLDKKYYNHLSFYRRIQVPEPGRNIQLSVKLKFNKKTS
jgi:iron complex outermembrane receptor protein